MSGEVDWTVNRTQLNMVVWEETGEERRGEERRGIPGLDIWDNLEPDITLERVLSRVREPGCDARAVETVVVVRDSFSKN